jgi:methylenetetrahydrofolate reductase (NADPH)
MTAGAESQAARLARDSSLELNWLEAGDLTAGRELLWPGQRIFVSHLPRQTWEQTLETCAQVAAAGFDPVPHIPVRRLKNAQELDRVLAAARNCGASELLLISGDCAEAEGPYSRVLDVLLSGTIQKHGFARLSVAGHPEGHPVVAAREIRQAQLDKGRWAAAAGIRMSLVTQFFFEAAPFIRWASDLRAAGVEARLVAGLPGPASLTRLLKLARHCGVGPSMRALSSHPGSMLKLLSERSPDGLLQDLAAQRQRQPDLLDGIHLFSFGGFLRTAAWLRQVCDRVPVPARIASSRR